MNYDEWVEHTNKVMTQYNEGAIFAREAFNAIVGKALEVEQTELERCPKCGATEIDGCYCAIEK